MNDLVKDLLKQSTYEILGVPQVDQNKFAELIIRECADVLKKDMELAHIQLIPLDFSMYANGRLQRTIKQHFGVEE